MVSSQIQLVGVELTVSNESRGPACLRFHQLAERKGAGALAFAVNWARPDDLLLKNINSIFSSVTILLPPKREKSDGY